MPPPPIPPAADSAKLATRLVGETEQNAKRGGHNRSKHESHVSDDNIGSDGSFCT